MNSLVRDMMTTDVVTVEASTPFKEIVARLAGRRVSAVPVVDADGRVLGVVSEADLLLKEEQSDGELGRPAGLDPAPPHRAGEGRRGGGGRAHDRAAGHRATHRHGGGGGAAHARRRGQAAAGGGRGRPAVGVVSRADLLKVFARPDDAIRREVVDEVILRDLMMDPSRFVVRVEDGVVCLEGAVERRSLVPFVLRAVQGVEGVVRVENRLTYDVDDRGRDVLMTPWLRP